MEAIKKLSIAASLKHLVKTHFLSQNISVCHDNTVPAEVFLTEAIKQNIMDLNLWIVSLLYNQGLKWDGVKWWDAGVVNCLGRGADLHMAQLMPLPLTISCSSKSRLVIPFWYWLTRVVPDKVQGGA